MRIPINNVGEYGVIQDVPDYILPPNAWTKADNIDFADGLAKKSAGHIVYADDVILRPQWLLPYLDDNSGAYFWIYPGLDDSGNGEIATYDGTNHVNRTRAAGGDYTKVASSPWTGGVLNGVCYINSGNDVPQIWQRTASVLNADFQNVTTGGNYWPASQTARVMRPFREFMISADIDDGTDRNPWLLQWSDASLPFTEPEWITTASNLAGDKPFSESGGYIKDFLSMRGSLIVYREDTTWVMRYIGGNDVFAFDQIFSEYGCLHTRCVKPFGNGMHFVVTTGDVIVHDGTTPKSIVDRRTRDKIFDNIDTDNYQTSFVVPNYRKDEMWFCYPVSGSDLPNVAARWHIKTNSWSFRSLSDISHIGYGVLPGQGTGPWSTDTDAWASDTTTWNEGKYNPAVQTLLGCHQEGTAANSNLFEMDTGSTFNGANMSVMLERTGLTVLATGTNGYITDESRMKHCQAIWPRVTGGPVNISVGAADQVGEAYKWDGPYSFNPASDYKVDVRVTGRLLGVRFSSASNVSWKLNGYDLDVVSRGNR